MEPTVNDGAPECTVEDQPVTIDEDGRVERHAERAPRGDVRRRHGQYREHVSRSADVEGGVPIERQTAYPVAHGECVCVPLVCFGVTQRAPLAQIPWGDDFEHKTGCELFGSNLLALTWIKGEAMPGELVDEILEGSDSSAKRTSSDSSACQREH